MVDQLIRATAAEGGIRVVGVITTDLTQEAKVRHNLSLLATASLGRAISSGLLLVSSMKKEGSRVNLRIKGNGPLGGLLVDAGLDGTVRGYVDNPDVELPLNDKGILDVGGAIGKDGYVYVVKDTGYGYPYSSTVKLVSGEIGEDIAHYLVNSEQTPSAHIVEVLMDSDSQEVAVSGGLLLQILPKAAKDYALIDLLESRISNLVSFTSLLQAGKKLPEIFEALLGDLGLNIFPEIQMLKFNCNCSSERLLGALNLLGEAEIKDMIEKDEGAEGTCHFCNEVYQASKDDLLKILQNI